MNKVKFIFTLTVIAFLSSSFFEPSKEEINWISFTELSKNYTLVKKPILVDVYTTWCGWCRVMDKNTYSNKKLATYVNEKYYAIKFDAESKIPIEFNGKTYKYDPANRVHELAIYLTFGRLEFPHTVLLQSPSSQPAPISGYLKPNQLEGPMKFFGEKADVSQTFVEFNKSLEKDW